MSGKKLTKRECFKTLTDGRRGRDGDDWMSDGSEWQRSDAATGNVRRPTAAVVGYSQALRCI